jgi:hypothetical protein
VEPVRLSQFLERSAAFGGPAAGETEGYRE